MIVFQDKFLRDNHIDSNLEPPYDDFRVAPRRYLFGPARRPNTGSFGSAGVDQTSVGRHRVAPYQATMRFGATTVMVAQTRPVGSTTLASRSGVESTVLPPSVRTSPPSMGCTVPRMKRVLCCGVGDDDPTEVWIVNKRRE